MMGSRFFSRFSEVFLGIFLFVSSDGVYENKKVCNDVKIGEVVGI